MLAKTLHLGGFVASMLAVGAWLRSVDTIPFWSWTQGKAAHVAKGGVDCDTLFLGSSRMHYGIAPAEFDAQMAQLGLPSKSWNLAFCGVRQHDQAAILDWLLAERPAGLKRVVVELHGFDQRLRGGKWLTDMQVEMHTPGQFLGRCSSILASGDGLWNKLEQFAFVTAHTAVNAMRVGQGCRILLDPLDQSRPAGLSRAEAADRGWRPNGDATHHSDNEVQAHAAFLAHPERAARVAQEKAVDPARSFLAGGFNHRAFAAQVEAARSAGIEILFVVMPTLTHDFQGRDGVDEASQRARILEMDRFAEHPLLGDPSLYYDASHLNEKGARVFSRALARAIARPQASRSSQALTLEVEATGPGKAAKLRLMAKSGSGSPANARRRRSATATRSASSCRRCSRSACSVRSTDRPPACWTGRKTCAWMGSICRLASCTKDAPSPSRPS